MLKSFVIVSVYNKGSDIISVLEAVTSENLEIVDLKVLVLKDGSSARAKELLAAIYLRFVEILKNSGKGALANAGLEQAIGDYVLIPHAPSHLRFSNHLRS